MNLLKLRALLWKNYLIRRRHCILTVFEVIIPVTLFLFISYARSKIPDFSKQYVNESTTPFPTSMQEIYRRIDIHDLHILYTPNTDFTENLVREVQLKLNIYNEGIHGFSNEGELEKYYDEQDGSIITAAIIFSDVGNAIPEKLKYDVRMHEQGILWRTDQLFGASNNYVPGAGSEMYLEKAFIPIQMALDTSFIELVAKDSPKLSLMFQEFPYPPHVVDLGISYLFIHMLPILTLFSFLFLWPTILKQLVEEKSSGIKELMKINGLDSGVLWFTWFINGFVPNLLSIVAIVLLLKLKIWDVPYAAIEYCCGVVLWLFLALYCAASITFCFAFSSFFSRPNVAMITGILFWMISYFVFNGIATYIDVLSWNIKLVFLLLPNIGLYYGYSAISTFESREIPLNFTTLFESPTGSSDDITMGCLMVVLLCDAVLYFAVTLYLDRVLPGPYGISQPWNYPVILLGNLFHRNIVSDANMKETDPHTEAVDNNKIEKSNLPTQIKIRNLRKTYDSTMVVDNLSLDIYMGQITTLLGHNGAGKTTTMSILTGMISATSGSVLINDLTIKDDFFKLRHLFSICPQHNLAFTDLTVLEQLIFFGMLRGLSKGDAQREALFLLNEKLHLGSKKNKLVSTLSGGMKRKVALGVALMGDPKILILDEPTSGIDIEARRDLWDLILSYKKTKTIIITTHFMEEADVLADRIAIMEHGSLICYGTPLFLKNSFDVGYHLTLKYRGDDDKAEDIKSSSPTTQPGAPGRTQRSGEEFNADAIDKFITDEIEGAYCKKKYGSTSIYYLPNHQKPNFSAMLRELNRRSADASNALSFKISNTSLEDVFLKVGDLATTREGKQSRSTCDTDSLLSQTNGTPWWQKFLVLFWKRCIYLKRRKFYYLFPVLLSLLITGMVLFLGESGMADATKDGPTLFIDLAVYGETGVLYNASGRHHRKIEKYYSELIQGQHSIPMKVDLVQESIIQKGIDNIAYYSHRMVVGAEFASVGESEEVTILYSNNALHGAPISLNMVTNTMLKVLVGDRYSIAASNTPLHSVTDKTTNLQQSATTSAIIWFVLFPLGPLFVVTNIISFIHAENSSTIKKLQYICGVYSWLYWIVNFVCDLLYYVMVMVVTHLLLLCLTYALALMSFYPFGNYLLFGAEEFGAIAFILAIYSFSIPFAYFCGFAKSVGTGYSAYLLVNIVAASSLTLTVLVMEKCGNVYYEKLSVTLRNIFALCPQFTLTYMSSNFIDKFTQNHNWNIKLESEKRYICEYSHGNPCCAPDSLECAVSRSYFNDASYMYVTLTAGAAYLFIIILIDSYIIRRWCSLLIHRISCICNEIKGDYYRSSDALDISLQSGNVPDNPLLDVRSHDPPKDNNVLKVNNVIKRYRSFTQNTSVIKELSFAVNKGECLGLLGVNGAGKSTTFRMLALQETPCFGEIFMNGKEVAGKVFDDNDTIGYCPQEDSLINELTGKELLKIMAALRGPHHEENVEAWLKELGLERYKDQPCGTYSGGNKRKLNTCISMIGMPFLIMLDEPTSGVDPVSRRALWDLISTVKSKKDSTIILSSHSMDECEFLCDRIIIMKEGRGENLKELREEFTVKIKLTNSSELTDQQGDEVDNENAVNKSGEKCPLTWHEQDVPLEAVVTESAEKIIKGLSEALKYNLETVDKHSGLIHVRVKNTNWIDLFNTLEELKSKNECIEDYSVSETSLEDMFLKVARENTEKGIAKSEIVKTGKRIKQTTTCVENENAAGVSNSPKTNRVRSVDPSAAAC